MKIGIIGAMDLEIQGLKERLKDVQEITKAKMTFSIGKIENTEVVVCKCLEGKVNSTIGTQILIDTFQVDEILNVGVAGGIHPDLLVGDIAISSQAVEFDLDTTVLGYELGYVFGLNKVNIPCDQKICHKLEKIAKKYANALVGTVATSDQFVTDEKQMEMLKSKFQAISVDMESASIAHTCYFNQIPFCALRIISDKGNHISYQEFMKQSLEKIENIICDYILE